MGCSATTSRRKGNMGKTVIRVFNVSAGKRGVFKIMKM